MKASSELTPLARQQKLNAAKHLSWLLEKARKELEEKPSHEKALEIQRLQAMRRKLQNEIRPTLITGKWNEDPQDTDQSEDGC